MLLAQMMRGDPAVVVGYLFGLLVSFVIAVSISAKMLRVGCSVMGVEPPMFPIAFAICGAVSLVSMVVLAACIVMMITARGGELPPLHSLQAPMRIVKAEVMANVIALIVSLFVAVAVYTSSFKIGFIRAMFISIIQIVLTSGLITIMLALMRAIFGASR